MSQRQEEGRMKQNYRDVKQTLLNFQQNLQNEHEIINSYYQLLSPKEIQNIADDIKIISTRIEEEIQFFKDLNYQINQTRSLSDSFDVESFHLLKLKYNKLILQIEKLHTNHPHIITITNKFSYTKLKSCNDMTLIKQTKKNKNSEYIPKSSHVISQILMKPPPFSASCISNNTTSIIPSQHPTSKSIAATTELIQNIAKRNSVEERNKDFIKRELISLKNLISNVNKKIDTHDHTEYELEMDRLRKDNNQIIHDYKILKNDNTEIMHSLRALQKTACEVKLQNDRLLQNISHLQFQRPSSPSANDIAQFENHIQHNPQQKNSKTNSLQLNSVEMTSNFKDMYNIESPHSFHQNNRETQGKDSANTIITRNNSQLHHANQDVLQTNPRQTTQRSLIPSQLSDRNESPIDNELLSSWARNRVIQ